MLKVLLLFILSFSFIKSEAQTCSIISADIVCREELISFDVTSSGTIQSVLWEMGDATTSTQKNFSHKYSSKGVKSVKVTVTLSGGGNYVATKKVTVYELPQFKLSNKSDNIYCLSQNRVCFIDSSTGGDAGINIKKRIILWDDGDISTSTNPPTGDIKCHTYTNTGTFKVTIELTNDKDCKSKKEVQVKILPDVVPVFNITSGSGCDSAQAFFEDITTKDSLQIINRIFTWGDGKKTITMNRKNYHYYKKAGFYTVSLSLVQKNGCTTTKDTVIEIFLPEITFDIIKDGYRKCFGKSYTFEQRDNLIGAIYDWSIEGEPGIQEKIINFSPQSLGKKKVSLLITFGGCSKLFQYDSIEVIGILPTIKVLNDNQCQNKDTVFFCEKDIRYGTKRVSFLWDFGDDIANPCTSSRKTGTNLKSNCNYTTDSIGKHFYLNGICRKYNLKIKDLDYGCDVSYDGFLNVVRPKDYEFKYVANRKCLGLKPDYRIAFENSLCPIIKINVNSDSSCDRKLFNPLSPFYVYQQTCSPDGWVTVGFAVKFGNKKVYRTYCDTSNYYIDPSRECFDTIWYHHWYRLLPEPFSPFEAEAKAKCIPSQVTTKMLDPRQKNISFSLWNWGDDSPQDTIYSKPGDSLIPEPTHTYKKAGAFSIKFYVENENRCYAVYSQIMILGFEMKMDFDTVICPGISVSFKEKINYLYSSVDYWHNPKRKNRESFKWDFGDGRGFVTDTAYPVYKFTKQGNFKIRLAAKDSTNCADTLIRFLNVGGVHAGIKAVTKKIICDDIIQFFDSSYSDFKPPSDSLVNYFWAFGDFRNPSYLKDPYHFYKNYGQFTILHKVENTRGCKDSAYITINIDGPKPQFDIVSDTVGCVPFTAEFKNTSYKTKDYIWFFGDPLKTKLSTNLDTNVKFTYTQPGTYYIYLYGSDSVVNPNTGSAIYYCKATFPDTTQLKHPIRRIVVLPIPKVDFDVIPFQCKGKPFVVTDKSDPIYKHYKWVMEKIDSTETIIKTGVLKSVKDTGTFIVKYTPWYSPAGSYQRQCYDTISKKVRITEIKALFDTIKDPFCPIYTFINKSTNYKTITWDLGHSASGESNNIHHKNEVTHNYVPDKGTFYPCLFVESIYGCRDTICTQFEVNFNIKALIPNVFTPGDQDNLNDAFDIVMDNMEEYDLSIFNRWGQLMYHSNYDGMGNDGANWDGKTKTGGINCPAGTYFYIFKYKFNCENKKREAHGMITLL